MATVYAVPPELLLGIFAKLPDPALASHVCHSWRTVALANTRLWASPTLTISSDTTFMQCNSFALHLTRSGAQSLSVALTTDIFDPKLSLLTCHAIRILVDHAYRVDTLELAVDAHAFYLFCVALNHGRALPLRKLSLTLSGWHFGTQGEATAAFFARTPALRTLTWGNCREWGAWDKPFASGVACVEMRVAWRGLTALVLDTHIDFDGALDVLVHADVLEIIKLKHLSEAPSGVYLGTEDGVPLRERYSSTAPLLLPHLRTLYIFSLVLDTALPDLLDHILCPALNDLSITLGSAPASELPSYIAGDAVRALIGRSANSDAFAQAHPRGLTSLKLENTGISSEQLADCLCYASATLERLELYEPQLRIPACVNDALLDALSARWAADSTSTGAQQNCKSDNAVLCRRLHTLVLHRVVFCTDGVLADTLRSRIAYQAQSTESQPNQESKLNASKITVARLGYVDVRFLKFQESVNAEDISYLRSGACPNERFFH